MVARQVKVISVNILLIIMGIILFVCLVITGYILWSVVSFIRAVMNLGGYSKPRRRGRGW